MVNRSGYEGACVEYLKEKTAFDNNMVPNRENFNMWSRNVKLMSIARSSEIINYLVPLLDNETEYEVEDWSAVADFGIVPSNYKPDTIKTRVCDIAFVSLLTPDSKSRVKQYINTKE